MRLHVSALALIAFLFLTGIAIGAVGDAGVSDGISSVQSSQIYPAGSGLQSSTAPYQTTQAGTAQGASQSLRASSPSQAPGYSAVAPQTGGPYEERMSADDLRLTQPQGESFQPDGNLNFVAATPPGSSEEGYRAAYGAGAGQGMIEDAADLGTGSWYYPGSVTSRNRFWVQTFSGLKTVAGCSYGGYLPLWADINAAGNFYVYEWYPGQWTPSVRWWSWTWPGYKKGWFTGDVPGWHILCYNCRDWSNYVYIYVWPTGSGSGTYGSGYGYGSTSGASPSYTAGTPAVAASYASPSMPTSTSNPLPSGAPTPPDPNAENLVLPDFNLLTASSVQSGYAAATNPASYSANYPASSSADYPMSYSTAYPFSYSPSQPVKSVQPSQSCPGCQAAAFTGTAVAGMTGTPAQNACVGCADQGSYGYQGMAMPYGQVAQAQTTYQAVSQTYQAVFPKSST